MQDAASPFGMPWSIFGFLVSALLFLVALVQLAVVVIRRRAKSRTRIWLLPLAALGAATWTFFTIARPVMVPSEFDPDGSECIINALGENPDFEVHWGTDCGRAFRTHLVISLGPTATMALLELAAAVASVSRFGGRTRVGGSAPTSSA